MSKPLSTPNGSPRKKPLPAALAANLWKPGQSGNPGGKGGTYYEMMRLARQFTPQATQILIDIASDPGEARSRIVAIGMLYDRAWGKAREYDPSEDKEEEIRPRFDPSRYTPEQLNEIERVFRMIAATQAGTENGRRSAQAAAPTTDGIAPTATKPLPSPTLGRDTRIYPRGTGWDR